MECVSCNNTIAINWGGSNKSLCEPCGGLSSEKSNFLKLVSGEFGLAKTFWFFWVLGSISVALLGGIALSNTDSSTELITGILFGGILVLYQMTVSVGLWHSATLYKGSAIWKYLTKTFIVLQVISIALNSILEIL